MTKVCIIGVYFGNLPDYFDLWLKSAERNNTIKFKVFTDQQRNDLPSNVEFIDMSLLRMKNLAETNIGLDVNLVRPYKCCDLKPAYGLIFKDYIQEFDYWGHCDFDLIWGDIRSYLDKYKIEEYDKFLPLGHLSLYRNTEDCRKYIFLPGSIHDFKEVCSSEQNFAFDEFSGIMRIYKENKLPFFEKRVFADISKIYRRFRLALDDINYDNQLFYWNKGKIYRLFEKGGELHNDEFMYIHFKERKDMRVHGNCINADCFLITNKGFYPFNEEEFTGDIISEYNLFPGRDVEDRELAVFNNNERKNKILRKVNKIIGRKENIR